MTKQINPGMHLHFDGKEKGVVILKVINRSSCIEGFYCEIVQHPTKEIGSRAHYRDALLSETKIIGGHGSVPA